MPFSDTLADTSRRSHTRRDAFLSDATWLVLSRSLGLSGRESQILRCILDDTPEAAIARELQISRHTVHSHLERLYRKLDVNSRCLAVMRVFAEYVRLHPGAPGQPAVGCTADARSAVLLAPLHRR